MPNAKRTLEPSVTRIQQPSVTRIQQEHNQEIDIPTVHYVSAKKTLYI